MMIEIEVREGLRGARWAASTTDPTPRVKTASGFGDTAWEAVANLMRFIYCRSA